MIRNTLESIEYVENCKHTVIYHYKEKYKRDNLKPQNLWIVVRRLLKIVGPKGVYQIDKKYRKKVVIKTLNQMTSDSYIESSINWGDFNELNNMIDNLNIDDIEEETYRGLEDGICSNCC